MIKYVHFEAFVSKQVRLFLFVSLVYWKGKIQHSQLLLFKNDVIDFVERIHLSLKVTQLLLF